MDFDKVFKQIDYVILCGKEGDIAGITHDSREVTRDYCYICLIGNADGHNFIQNAIDNGAAYIVVQKDRASVISKYACGASNAITFISVADTRVFYALAASNFYGNPDRELKLIGITGTNGKTTTCKIVYDVLRRLGIRTGLIGTVCNCIGGDKLESTMTTPDPMRFYELLRAMVNSGCEYAVTEVSAHAIYLRKMEGCRFAALGFTNLSRDHLDFFGDMERYKNIKKSLFLKADCPIVVNGDDGCGAEILKTRSDIPVLSYGVENQDEYLENENNTDFCAVLNNNDDDCGIFELYSDGGKTSVKSGLKGKFNVFNALCALGLLNVLGFDLSKTAPELANIEPPDGRFEIRVINGINFIIDYAHTPDGMEKVLQEARRITGGKLYCVFGCGGDRDKTKRPIMGAIAEKYCDKAIITSDNPRGEDRMKIIDEIFGGIKDGGKAVKCAVRFHAILYACKCAEAGDTVAVLGKGHENYIEENGIKIKYSDIESIERIMKFNWKNAD